MKDVTEKNFGVVIAFLLPGFLFLWGLSFSLDEVSVWLYNSTVNTSPTVGGFLFATLASLSLGLLISSVRWLVIDFILKLTGVKDPGLNYSMLKDKDKYAAFIGVIENHYRYYQYYSNTLVSIVLAFIFYLIFGNENLSTWHYIVIFAIGIALFTGSRDALKKYYERANAILSE